MERVGVQADRYSSYWERLARTTWGRYVSEIERDTLMRAHRLAAEPTVALDVGCGRGQWSRFLAGLGWRMVCTDIDQRNLDSCKAQVPDATCVLVDANDARLPCASGSAGLVICIEVAAVMQTDWFLDEAARVLASGGLLVGVVLNRLSWRGLLKNPPGLSQDGFTWYRYAYPTWKRRLRSSEFALVHRAGYCWFPFKRTSNSFFVPPAIRAERYSGLRKLVTLSPYVIFIARKV